MINIPFHNAALAQHNDLGIFAALPFKSKSCQVQQHLQKHLLERMRCMIGHVRKREEFPAVICLSVETGMEGTQVH